MRKLIHFLLLFYLPVFHLRDIKRVFELEPAALIAASEPDRSNRKSKINQKLLDYNSISSKALAISSFVTLGKNSIKYLITIDE